MMIEEHEIEHWHIELDSSGVEFAVHDSARLEELIDDATQAVCAVQRVQSIDSIATSLFSSAESSAVVQIIFSRLSRAVVRLQRERATILFSLASLAALYGCLDKTKKLALLIISPCVENSDLGDFGRLQLLFSAFRSGLCEEAEQAMDAMLDFRERSVESVRSSLWATGCLLAALKTDSKQFNHQQKLAEDGLALALLLDDQGKFQRNKFSQAHAMLMMQCHKRTPDLFASLRSDRNNGRSLLSFTAQQLVMLYSCRDACARGHYVKAASLCQATAEDLDNSPSFVKTLYRIEHARIAHARGRENVARDHLREAAARLTIDPHTLNHQVFTALNRQLRNPVPLSYKVPDQRKMHEVVDRLYLKYCRARRYALLTGQLRA